MYALTSRAENARPVEGWQSTDSHPGQSLDSWTVLFESNAAFSVLVARLGNDAPVKLRQASLVQTRIPKANCKTIDQIVSGADTTLSV
jgi:hypothetical protein